MLLFFPLRVTYFISTEPNLSSPLILKSIETIKWYIIPMKELNTQKAVKCKNAFTAPPTQSRLPKYSLTLRNNLFTGDKRLQDLA
jgi:hypothetical protein